MLVAEDTLNIVLGRPTNIITTNVYRPGDRRWRLTRYTWPCGCLAEMRGGAARFALAWCMDHAATYALPLGGATRFEA